MKKALENTIKTAKEQYYNGEPSIDDATYDALEDELRAVDPDNELLKIVGSEATSQWKKITHAVPMGSLDKCQNSDEFKAWVDRHELVNEQMVVIEKLDGISIDLVYKEGKLQHAGTRGVGTVGEDITSNVVRMQGVKTSLPLPFTGSLRGEIVITKKDFDKHFQSYRNRRNAASGTAKRFDGEKCEHLTVLYYNVLGNDDCTTYLGRLTYLDTMLYLKTPNYWAIPENKYTVFSSVENHMEQAAAKRESLGYDVDGLVIRVNDMEKFNKLGELNLRPRGSIAYKFIASSKVTTVKEVTWQVGRSGRITPVAEIEPIDLGGTTIGRVTLHTAANAIKIGAGPGAKVLIIRSNDVIPKMERVLDPKPVCAPVMCPICKDPLEWEGEYLACTSPVCPSVLFNAVKVWTERLSCLQYGDALVENLIDGGYVKSLPDLYTVDWKKFGEEFGDGIAERARKSLQEHATEVELSEFIVALGIRQCQTTASAIISAGYDTIDKFMNLTFDDLLKINGVGEVKAEFISAGIKQVRSVVVELLKHITIKEKKMTKKGKLNGVSFVFTGKSTLSRKELTNLAEAAGAEVKSSVGSSVTYLVMADPASVSSKAEKARKLGTKCISEETFMDMVK